MGGFGSNRGSTMELGKMTFLAFVWPNFWVKKVKTTLAVLTFFMAMGAFGQTVSIIAGDDATENGGTVGTFSLNAGGYFGPDFTVNYEISVSSTATEGTDFQTLTGSVQMVDRPIVLTKQGSIQIFALDDLVHEGDETVTITLLDGPDYDVDVSNGEATISILDDDPLGVVVSPNATTLAEAGGTGTITVTLTSQPTAPVTVPLSSSDPSKLSLSPTPVQLDATNWDTGVEVTATALPNNIDEADPVVTIDAGDITSADTFYDALGAADVADVAVTIMDDDTAGVTVDPLNGLVTNEGGGTDTFTVVLDSEPTANVTITISSSNTAEGTVSLGTLTFTSGDYSTPQQITVTGVEDTELDGDQAYTLDISTTSTDGNYNGLATQVSAINEDNDIPVVSVTASDPNASETGPDAGTFTISLDRVNNTGSNFVVNFNLSGDSALEGTDYDAIGTSVSIPNGSSSASVTINPVDDEVVEGDETVDLTLQPNTAYSVDTSGNDTASLTIADNDTAILTIANASFAENAGTVTVTATLDKEVVDGFAVDVTVTGGTAISGNDYIFTSQTLNFTGVAGEPQNISIELNNDELVEPDETITLGFTNLQNTSLPVSLTNTGTVTINNDDVVTVRFSTAASSDLEDSGSNLPTLLVTGTVTNPSTVQVTVSGDVNGADYDLVSPTINIPADTYNNRPIPLGLTINNDNQVEGNENLVLTLNNPSSEITVGTPNSTTYTIQEDDRNGFVVSSPSASENAGNMIFTVTLNGNNQLGDVTINYATNNGSALDGTDYTAISGTLTFPNGVDQSQNISVPILDDAIVEGDKTFTMTLSGSSRPLFSPIVTGSGTGTILEDDLCAAGSTAPVLNSSLPSSFCGTITADLADYVTSATPAGTELVWSLSSDPQETDAFLTNTEVSVEGSYFAFYYSEAQLCASPVAELTLVSNPAPTVDSITAAERCGEGTVTLTATASPGATLRWYANATGGSLLGTGGSFVTPSITSTTSFYVEAVAGSCVSERREVVATVIPGIVAMDLSACNVDQGAGESQVDLDNALTNANTGTWSFVSGPGNPSIASGNVVNFNGLPTGDYVFSFEGSGSNAACTDQTVQMTVSVGDCGAQVDLALTKTVDNENPTTGDTITFTITVENTSGASATAIVVQDILDAGFSYVSSNPSVGNVDLETGEWTIPQLAGNATATLEIVVEVVQSGELQNTASILSSLPEDSNADNDTDTVTLRAGIFIPDGCALIYNQISPNGDGVNDTFKITCMNIFPNSRLEIFDRYGNSVYSASPYDNSWDGTGKNGVLPKGTYFYILELGDGVETKKGWIQILR